ncbi:MAG: hypothetical protein RR569_03945 [Acinetobacter sp.]
MTYNLSYQQFSLEEYSSKIFKNEDEYVKYFQEKLNNFFYENYTKTPEILNNAFEILGFEYLLLKNENLVFAHKMLNDKVFFEYLRKNKFGVIHIVFIIWVCDNTSEIKIEKIKQNNSKNVKFIENSKKKFHAFLNHSEDMVDFKEWYKNEFEKHLARLHITLSTSVAKNNSQKELCYKFIIENSKSEIISDIEILFENYIEEIYLYNINHNPLIKKEDNVIENKFIRDLYSLLNSNFPVLGSEIIIKNSLFTHLLSIFYDKHMDEKQVSNVLKNSNMSTALSEFKCSFFIDNENKVCVKIERRSD